MKWPSSCFLFSANRFTTLLGQAGLVAMIAGCSSTGGQQNQQAAEYCLSAGKQQTFDCNNQDGSLYSGPLRIRDLPIDDETLYARLEETKRWLATRKAELTGEATPVAENTEELIPAAPQAQAPISTPEEALAAALALAQRGEFDTAMTLAHEYRELTLDDLSATLVESRILFIKADYVRARQLLEESIQRYPQVPELYNNLAAIQAAQGETGAAINTLQAAFATDPSFARIQANLKNLYSASARHAMQPDLPAPRPTLDMIEQIP
ncbi:tetratricopeptide repeat protein [Marinobacterium lutimaris]|uniref:Tetratricopeptide repeat-containing protein n=1 Tax=Marinobacterium lutimaris TaxID=568106 RepID=A0A1H6CHG5_9GAMM|nr:tetratricopeptide repeat protein [Marinobacterium lutimaris]SEG72421.1 Tetratricopeptide repeat-containing protein [Marinobacterium lutimaris]